MLSHPLAYNAQNLPDELKQFTVPEDITK